MVNVSLALLFSTLLLFIVFINIVIGGFFAVSTVCVKHSNAFSFIVLLLVSMLFSHSFLIKAH